MIKLIDLLVERIDYDHTANYLVKYYKLKSKVKVGGAKYDYGDYIPEKDLILLHRSYPSIKEFIISVLHEIKHALDAKQLGVRKYVKKYNQAGTMAVHRGRHPHDDNKWEERAERWAQKEWRTKWKRKFG